MNSGKSPNNAASQSHFLVALRASCTPFSLDFFGFFRSHCAKRNLISSFHKFINIYEHKFGSAHGAWVCVAVLHENAFNLKQIYPKVTSSSLDSNKQQLKWHPTCRNRRVREGNVCGKERNVHPVQSCRRLQIIWNGVRSHHHHRRQTFNHVTLIPCSKCIRCASVHFTSKQTGIKFNRNWVRWYNAYHILIICTTMYVYCVRIVSVDETNNDICCSQRHPLPLHPPLRHTPASLPHKYDLITWTYVCLSHCCRCCCCWCA